MNLMKMVVIFCVEGICSRSYLCLRVAEFAKDLEKTFVSYKTGVIHKLRNLIKVSKLSILFADNISFFVFDLNGKITDFRFALDAQVRESMTNCGNGVVDKERSMLILQYIERFRTAYNTKDINFLQDIFSDDALIITGKVVTRKSFQDATIKISPQVTYKKQNKTQYINNLRRAFARNQWIDVKFEQIANGGSTGCGGITRSDKNPNLYGVRLRQEWKSSTYSDEGYVFLLWNFADPDKPEITVRTWQPEFLDAAKTQRLPEEEIFSLSTVGDF